MSGGRLVVGVGFGWNREEMESHGVDYKRRREIVREKMLAIQALWTNEVAGFAGEHVRFEPSWQWPKPLQKPRPPVLIGGAGLKAALPELRRAFEARGRDPATLQVVPMGVLPDAGKLEHYASIGVTEAVLRLPSAPRDVVMPVLDGYARFVGSRPTGLGG